MDWYGSDGTGERVVERMLHTPDLPFRAVASEPTLVYGRKYAFTMTHDKGRVMRMHPEWTLHTVMDVEAAAWLAEGSLRH